MFLKTNEEVLDVTCRPSTLTSAFKISSVIPSLKYSFSGSALILTNGSTAILFTDFTLSDFNSPEEGTFILPDATANISTCRLTFLSSNFPNDFVIISGWLLSSACNLSEIITEPGTEIDSILDATFTPSP